MRPLASLILVAGACHGSGASLDEPGPDAGETEPAPTAPDASAPAATIPFSCPAGTTIAAGTDTIMVDGVARSFYVDLPADTTRPLGVVFSWHGFNQAAADFRTMVALDPDADPDHPVIIITPNDTGLLPPLGLDWNIVKQGPTNNDLRMFEAITGCLNAQYTIDAVTSFGFSAGSVMTNLVHASYPKLVTTIVTESGAWFDDPAEVALVTIDPMPWDWPALDPDSNVDMLLTHGGPNDVTVLNIISLENAAQAAFPFLKTNGRIVMDCAHTLGHAIDPDVSPATIIKFLTGHRATTDMPDSCMLRMP